MSTESRSEDSLRIESERVGDATVLRLYGHIDEIGADALSTALDETMDGGCFRIVMDLGDVRFMSSTGLGQIMRTYRAVREHDGYLKVINPQPLISDLFSITKLNTLLDIYPSVEDALRDEL